MPRPCSPTGRRSRRGRSSGPRASGRARDLARLTLPLDDRGRVVVDAHLRVAGQSDAWSLGDCAAVPNAATPGRFDPPTCQHALRQARRLARNNLRRPEEPYAYRMLGQVATLGRYKGIAELPGFRLRGFLGWFVARTYHLYALPMVRRKIRVVADWTVSLGFRRDIVELSALGRRHGSTGTRAYRRTQRSARSAEPSDCPPSSTRANRSPSFATRSSTASIVNASGSSPGRTSSQRSGVETGAPDRGRTE